MTKKILKPVTSEDFYAIHHVEQPRLHPGGKRIAYVHSSPEEEGRSYINSIWVTHSLTGKPRQFTTGGKGGDHTPRWSPDGKKLAFISSRSGKPQVYIIPLNGGEAIPLTSMKNGAGAPVWSPDSKTMAFVSSTREDEREQEDKPARRKGFISERDQKRMDEDESYREEMRDDPRVYDKTIVKQGTSFVDGRHSHIYIQKIRGGKPKRLTEGEFDFSLPEWTPDGKFILTSTKQKGNTDIVVQADLVRIDVDSGKTEFLTDDKNGNYNPVLSPDGKWIYYVSFQAEELYKQRMLLKRIPATGGKSETVIPGYDLDIMSFQLSSDGKWIYFGVGREGREIICRVSVGGGQPEDIICEDGFAGSFHLVDDTIVYRFESPAIPSDIFWKRISDDTVRRVTRINDKFLKSRALSLPVEIWLDRPDGTRVQGWFMKPHGYRKGKRYPWVVQVHGGPHIMWGFSWAHEYQAMCARGYGVYFSNPRGSEGYGSEFKGAIHMKWGEEDSQDILAGADEMIQRKLADPKRLYLTGGSFGGFMTAWIIGHDNRFKAAAAQRGVYNFISMYGASDALTLIEWEFETLPWKNTDFLWDRSPLKYVENITTPLMIIHSENDFRVGISQAEELFVALKRLEKDARLVRYPREGHELSRSGEPRHRVDRINKIVDWFELHP